MKQREHKYTAVGSIIGTVTLREVGFIKYLMTINPAPKNISQGYLSACAPRNM